MPPTTVGRKSPPGRAAAPKKTKSDATPAAMRLTLGEFGSFTLEPDWTARLAARCRRELGCTPEQIFQEISGVAGGSASVDTVVRLFVFAAWQCGADLSYDDLLDEVRVSTPFTIEVDPAEGDSPEV